MLKALGFNSLIVIFLRAISFKRQPAPPYSASSGKALGGEFAGATGASARAAAVTAALMRAEVRRCKLDPDLKAPGFKV